MDLTNSSHAVTRFTIKSAVPLLAYVSGYLLLVGWFKFVDVYHSHFSSSGPLLLAHNVFRVVFIFYLFFLIQSVGALLLRLIARETLTTATPLEYIALTFFGGAGPWHLLLLALGYLNLITLSVMIALTLPVVVMSFGEFRTVRRLLQGRLGESKSGGFIWALLALSLSALLLTKGLYPGGGHDYYTHYFYSYLAVLDSGGIWPNDVWYHYYYSKGAGLFFLAMLLTDPLAPQLVTFCFVAVSALVVFLFIEHFAKNTWWPFAGTFLFFSLLIYSPGWGEFEKLHEFNTVFVIASLWATAEALSGKSPRLWLTCAASAVTAAVIVNLTVGPYLATVFGILGFVILPFAGLCRAAMPLSLAFLSAGLVGAFFAINYLTTGLINDQGILHFWKFADVEKLYRWGALAPVLLQHWGAMGMAAESVSIISSPKFLKQVMRLDLLYPLVGGGAVIAGIAIIQHFRIGKRWPLSWHALVLGIAILCYIALAMLAGRAQNVSFYRYSSFIVPVIIVAAAGWWALPLFLVPGAHWFQRWWTQRVPATIAALCAILIVFGTDLQRRFLNIAGNTLGYASGLLSIDDAYQRALFSYLPWGAIYPAARGAYAAVGPNVPIWSLHILTYCMLPGCKMKSVHSFSMTPDWDRLMWGSPEEGRNLLQTAGLNHFFFSREIEIHDHLPRSQLFSPDNIGRYLGIRWTDRIGTLLTWLGPETTKLDDEWIASYRSAVEASRTVQSFPDEAMRAAFAQLRASPHPWRAFRLPWERHLD
jgi:hypothetical protein